MKINVSCNRKKRSLKGCQTEKRKNEEKENDPNLDLNLGPWVYEVRLSQMSNIST